MNTDPKRMYQWPKQALTTVAAARGAELAPATVAEWRQLRAANQRQAQKPDMFKKPLPVACYKRGLSVSDTPGAATTLAQRAHYPVPLLCQVAGVPASSCYA